MSKAVGWGGRDHATSEGRLAEGEEAGGLPHLLPCLLTTTSSLPPSLPLLTSLPSGWLASSPALPFLWPWWQSILP